MTADHLRDAAMGALILGFLASAWFGWAQENPPTSWRMRLAAGSIVSLLVAIGGGVLAWQNWDESSALNHSEATTRFIVIFWLQVVIIAVGCVLLARRQHAQWFAPWIAFVVGVHFLPLGPIFGDPTYIVLGIVMAFAAIGTALLARQRSITPSAITGATAGTILLIAAMWNVVRVLV